MPDPLAPHALSQAARDARVRALVAQHLDFVGRSLRRLGVRSADVDDAVQEVFVVAARRLDALTPTRERAFLFGTAVRVCSTRRRSARRHPEELAGAADEHAHTALDPESLLELAEARVTLRELLDGMGPELGAVFAAAELDELTAREIGLKLGIPEGTVCSRLRTAREKFRAGVERRAARTAFEAERARARRIPAVGTAGFC